MPLYRKNGRMIFFIHIPKTGGTTIEEILCGVGAKQALKFHQRLKFSACTPQHMHAEIYKNFISGNFYDYAFTVVRNPFTRIVSEYKWRMRGGKNPHSFDEWVAASLATVIEHPYYYDNHLRKQTEFLTQRVEVFRFEDGLEKPVAKALAALKIETQAPVIHRAKEADSSQVNASQQTIEKIRGFYKDDFEQLGYPIKIIPGNLVVS